MLVCSGKDFMKLMREVGGGRGLISRTVKRRVFIAK